MSVQSLRYANRDLVGFFMQVDGGGMDQIWILVGIFYDFFCAEYIIAMYGDLENPPDLSAASRSNEK